MPSACLNRSSKFTERDHNVSPMTACAKTVLWTDHERRVVMNRLLLACGGLVASALLIPVDADARRGGGGGGFRGGGGGGFGGGHRVAVHRGGGHRVGMGSG